MQTTPEITLAIIPWIVYPLIGLVAAGIGYAVTGFLAEGPPPDAIWAMKYSSGKWLLTAGTLENWRMEAVRGLDMPDLSEGSFIALSATSELLFSDSIPQEFHQRLRNILS